MPQDPILRIPSELHRRIKMQAALEGMTLFAFTQKILNRALQSQPQDQTEKIVPEIVLPESDDEPEVQPKQWEKVDIVLP